MPFSRFEPNRPEAKRRRFRLIPVRTLLPNLITLLALCAGLTAIRLAVEQKLEWAVAAIVFAALLDGIDGRVARMLKGTSRFGAELDSLADFVNFGVAPALILYFWGLHELGNAGWIAAMVFAICTGLRLARFNVMIDDPNKPAWAAKFFVGVPAPAGAITVLLPIYVYFLGMPRLFFIAPLTLVYTLAIAFLMVSRLPVISGKRVGKRIAPEMVLPVFVAVVLFFALLISYPWIVLTIGTVCYLASLPLGFISYRRHERRDAAAARRRRPRMRSRLPRRRANRRRGRPSSLPPSALPGSTGDAVSAGSESLHAMARLNDKIVLITGAAGAVGTAVAAAVTREGGSAIATDLAPRTGIDHGLDVTAEDDWQRVLGEIERARGGLDGLVNAAGIALLGTIEDTDYASWRRVLAVNLDGTFLGCKHALALLKRRGGSIVNLSSISGIVGGHNLTAYNASKGGVRLLTKSVALHGARLKPPVRCNSVHPAFLEGAMVDDILAQTGRPEIARTQLARDIPLGRLGEPSEVAELCVYLLSDESRFVTGSEFIIDGGLTAR